MLTLSCHIAERTTILVGDRRFQGISGSPALITDELQKLAQLRVRGVVTQEEFDSQRAKLLAR